MRVQNNNQPNFGIKVQVQRGLAELIVKEGWEKEAANTISAFENRFPADKSEVHVSIAYDGFVKSGSYSRKRHIGDAVELKRALVGAVADKKAIASLPQHVQNLNKKYGLNIVFNHAKALERSEKPRDFFANLTKIAKDLAQVPHKEKYDVKIGPNWQSGFDVEIARGRGKNRHTESFEFYPSTPIDSKSTHVKDTVNELESSIKYHREQAKKAAVKKKFDASVDAFMASINGSK